MRWMALVLVVGVFVAHDGANWISSWSGVYPWAVFFMLQGGWTVVLAACVALFIYGAMPSLERSLALAALGIAMVEGIEIPACGLAVKDFTLIPRGVNTCDYVTGLPLGAVQICLEVFILAWLIGSYLRR